MQISKNSEISYEKNICPLRKNWLNEVGQTERWTNKMKLTVAYHYFADNLKNSLKI